MENVSILLISGSVQKQSYTRTATIAVADALAQRGANVTHWNLLEQPLPIMIPELRDDVLNHPDERVQTFAKTAIASDAFVFGSPIYHNSYSGVLKNAIDHLRNPHFAYKPIGLIGHGGDGSKQAVDHLRIVCRGVNAVATPTIVCTSEEHYEELPDQMGYRLTDTSILQRIDRLADELMLFATHMRPIREAMVVKNK